LIGSQDKTMTPIAAAFFDRAARNIAVRLTLASMLAMATATAMSLTNPWWAAMAVWMVGQPPRGLLFERGLAQLLGSVLGAAAGVALILPLPGVPAASLFGLAVWIAVCCGIANVMRHQRAYGAALCGLTSAVIVSLTLGTSIDPVGFAVARTLDTVIGIASAIMIALWLGPPAPGSTVATRAGKITSQALGLIAECLAEPGRPSPAREREFLLSLASLDASAEDAAAGSVSARRKLKELRALFAHLLDFLVVARAIRSREASTLFRGHEDMAVLRKAFNRAADDLLARGELDATEICVASQGLEKAAPLLSPVLEEMRTLLLGAVAGYQRVMADARETVPRWSAAHPDISALSVAMLRSVLVVSLVGLAWLVIDWNSMRYMVLGACIFTVLFSAVDEPVPMIRQVLLGGAAAATAALLWRVVVLPEVPNGWYSLALATPLVFGASLLQARQGTVFVGLAFNMLFAVLARPVDTLPSSAIGLAGIEAMLLCGIVVTYAFYRWLLPMDTQRRRRHLKASIRREIAAISVRAATPWAGRHLARLRYLVFNVAVRSRGQDQEAEDALAALSLGHALFRLGEMEPAPDLPDPDRRIVRETLRLMAAPLVDPQDAGEKLRHYAGQITPLASTGDASAAAHASRIRWLLGLAADDLTGHLSIFTSPQPSPLRTPPSQ
jgi:uncharacterized membrane protein YccC